MCDEDEDCDLFAGLPLRIPDVVAYCAWVWCFVVMHHSIYSTVTLVWDGREISCAIFGCIGLAYYKIINIDLG